VQLPHDHHCPWRELAESMERRFAETVARMQRIIDEQAKLIDELRAELERQGREKAEHVAKIARLEAEVQRLERDLVGRKSEKLKIPPHERDRGDGEVTDEDRARRRAEAEAKRRERAIERDAALTVEEVEVVIPDAMKPCPDCGSAEHGPLPPEITTRIEYVPGRFVKRRHRRAKIVRKCRCPGRSIVVAPAPPAPIAGRSSPEFCVIGHQQEALESHDQAACLGSFA
jgi:uncharacterized coiled-coil protein SlyX